MARYSTLRASDADRDAVADRLRTAAVEGRLEPDELDERVGLALRARTYGDLERLLLDLPSGWARPRQKTPIVREALSLTVRLVGMLAILALVLVGIAVSATWLIIWGVVFLALRARHGCPAARRVQRPPRRASAA